MGASTKGGVPAIPMSGQNPWLLPGQRTPQQQVANTLSQSNGTGSPITIGPAPPQQPSNPATSNAAVTQQQLMSLLPYLGTLGGGGGMGAGGGWNSPTNDQATLPAYLQGPAGGGMGAGSPMMQALQDYNNAGSGSFMQMGQRQGEMQNQANDWASRYAPYRR